MVLAAALLAHASGRREWAPVTHLDAWNHDTRLRLFARATPDDRVAVVAIDEASLAALGRWPWNRARIADLVEVLFTRYGIEQLGLDLILAEPDPSSGLPALEAMARGPLRGDTAFQEVLKSQRAVLDHDGQLATTLRAHRVVLGFHLSDGPDAARAGALPPVLMGASGLGALSSFSGFGGNLPQLQSAAADAGFLNAIVDRDGVRRRAPLLARLGPDVHASLALAMAREALGHGTLMSMQGARPGGAGPESLRLSSPKRDVLIPLGAGAQVLLPYPARTAMAPTHSAADVLAGRIPTERLRGRIVLIGATAPGLADLHATPVAGNLPGVQAHAALVGAILAGEVPVTPAWTPGLEMAVLVAVLLAGIAMARLRFRGATLWAIGLGAAMVAGNCAAWSVAHLGLPLAGPMLLLAAMFGWHMTIGYFTESRQRRRLASLFGQYVPPELVAHMAHDPSRYDMHGRSANLTVMFADLRGFTSLSESLPPAELAALINEFLSEMTDIVRAHGGTLDKYVGDAVMAFWGAPIADELHATHAVQAALAMQAAMPALNERFAQREWPAMSLGIGINSGAMVVGDLGSRHRRAYTVLGDAVNVAARLQELTAHYGQPIILGRGTAMALPPEHCRELDDVLLRGRRARELIFVPRFGASRGAAKHDPANH